MMKKKKINHLYLKVTTGFDSRLAHITLSSRSLFPPYSPTALLILSGLKAVLSYISHRSAASGSARYPLHVATSSVRQHGLPLALPQESLASDNVKIGDIPALLKRWAWKLSRKFISSSSENIAAPGWLEAVDTTIYQDRDANSLSRNVSAHDWIGRRRQTTWPMYEIYSKGWFKIFWSFVDSRRINQDSVSIS